MGINGCLRSPLSLRLLRLRRVRSPRSRTNGPRRSSSAPHFFGPPAQEERKRSVGVGARFEDGPCEEMRPSILWLGLLWVSGVVAPREAAAGGCRDGMGARESERGALSTCGAEVGYLGERKMGQFEVLGSVEEGGRRSLLESAL